MTNVRPEDEEWEMTIHYLDGTTSKPKKVKGLGAALEYEERQTRNRKVEKVTGKRVK